MGQSAARAADAYIYSVAGDGDTVSGALPDGAVATDIAVDAGCVAGLADGSFLVASGESAFTAGGRVLRIDRAGRIHPFAGTGRSGYSGDGPATRARINGCRLAPVADGSVLLADDGNDRVRRVDANGVITTVAGDGIEGEKGNGGPAGAAELDGPGAVASLPDGGFLIGEHVSSSIRRVAADGTISTLSESGDRGLAVAADGSAVIARDRMIELASASDGKVWKVIPVPSRLAPVDWVNGGLDGRVLFTAGGCTVTSLLTAGCTIGELTATDQVSVLAGGGQAGFFGSSNGDPAREADLGSVSDVAPSSDGGVLIAAGSAVLWAAPPHPAKLAVAITRQSLPLLGQRRFALRSTRHASVVIAIYQRGRRLARRTGRVRAGLNTLRLPRGASPGIDTLRVEATTTRDRASASHRILVGRALPPSYAHDDAEGASGDGGSSAGCHAWSPVRTDCKVHWVSNCDSTGSCDEDCFILAIVLRPNGIIYNRRYGSAGDQCSGGVRQLRFLRRPRWRGAAVEAPPL